MNLPSSYSHYSHSQRTINFENSENEKGWAESLPLQEKNYNVNHAMNSTVYKSLTKKNQLNKKRLNMKFLRMQHGQVIGQTCLNFFKKQPQTNNKENLDDSISKGSNFEVLKRQIQYLQQSDFDNQKFPNHSPPLSKNDSLCFSNHLKNTDVNLYKKTNILSSKPLNSNFLATCKNLTIKRQRPGTSQNKQAKKYFSNSKKKSSRKNAILINECQEIIHTKNYNKFQLIAPFRKYFQSKRNRKNRSCTLKIDELYGKKLNKLTHLTLESS